ncbi:MAG: hypothetical protein ABSG26_17120 [Bryobacteraceae bacterium]|jgi:hypothetical protein
MEPLKRNCYLCPRPATAVRVPLSDGEYYVVTGCKCVRYLIGVEYAEAIEKDPAGTEDRRRFLSAAARTIAEAEGEPPPRLSDYAKRYQGKWWLQITDSNADQIAPAGSFLETQEIQAALAEAQNLREALAKSSHFQRSDQQEILEKDFSFIESEIGSPPEFRKPKDLKGVVEYLRSFANTPELEKAFSRMEKKLKAIGALPEE